MISISINKLGLSCAKLSLNWAIKLRLSFLVAGGIETKVNSAQLSWDLG